VLDHSEYEHHELSENELRLRGDAAVRLACSIESYYTEKAARDICIAGRYLDATGHTTSGVIRALRIGGRLDHCVFIETDPDSGEPVSFDFFCIEEDGKVSDAVDTLVLAKAAAVSENLSTSISHQRFAEVKNQLGDRRWSASRPGQILPD